jgi:hypothetical protein
LSALNASLHWFHSPGQSSSSGDTTQWIGSLRDPFIESTKRIDIMRKQTVLALLAATLSGAAFAAPAANQDMQRAALASVPVVGSNAAYKLRPFELDEVQGVYALADGRYLRVTHEHRKLYAEIDGAKAEIVPVARNRFASPDDSLRLAFEQVPFAEPEVRLSELAK